jgi:hypothetical protein
VDQELVSHDKLVRLLGLVIVSILLSTGSARAGIGESPDIEVIFQFTLAPAGLTALSDGTWVLGVNQSEKSRLRAVHLSKGGEVTPFPNEKMAMGEPCDAPLDAVEALQTDSAGTVWMLDNGRRSELPAKLVGWDTDKKRVRQLFNFAPPAIVPGSFLSDLAIDPGSQLVFISDPASGSNAGLIVLNRATGTAHRILQGHPSMMPDPSVSLRATRTGKETRRIDGTATMAHTGVRPLVLDRKAQWLYYAPVQSRAIYRIPVAMLRSGETDNDKLVAAIERYAEKPAAASLAIDNKNNLYVGDIEGRAIGCIEADKRGYRVLASDARLVWPDALTFGQDGKLYFVSRTQANVTSSRTAPTPTAEHSMFRLVPLAPGVPGS